MRFGISVLAAVAALTSFELLATGTPAATVQTAQAQDLSSSMQFKVKKLTTNINKSRKSLAGQASVLAADEFKAKQFGQRIDNFANSLKKYPANSDPAFAAAQAELTALQNEFAALKGGAAAPAPAQAADTPAAAPLPASGLSSTQKNKLVALSGNMDRSRKLLLSSGVERLQNPAEVEKLKKTLGEYTADLGAFKANQSDPLVQRTLQTYQALIATAQDTFAKANTAKAASNDVAAELADLREAMAAADVPRTLLIPFTEDEAKNWVARTRAVKTTGERVMAETQKMLGGASAQKAQSLYGFAQSQIRRANEVVTETERNFAGDFDAQHDLDFHRKRDPENKQHVAMMLQEGSEERTYKQLDRLMKNAESHAFYEKAKTGSISAEKQARIDEVAALRKRYGEIRIQAIGDSSLPEPKSTDAKRLEIAKAILDTPKYDFGEYGPIVLTTENIDSRTQKVSRTEIKEIDVNMSGDLVWSGTEESWTYDWDEFSFATPIKDENGDWYVWWIKATFYRSGGSTTPLNKWLSGTTTKGSLILEKNFR